MEYTFTFTPAETEIIMRGLGKLVGEQMFAPLCKLMAQKDAQDKARATAQPSAEHSQSVRDVGSIRGIDHDA